MIRIVCPHCHIPLGRDELEQAIMAGLLCLVCPECTTVLVSEQLPEHEALQHLEADAHA